MSCKICNIKHELYENYVHCCQCNLIYNKYDTHCCKCHISYANYYNHCCVCQTCTMEWYDKKAVYCCNFNCKFFNDLNVNNNCVACNINLHECVYKK